MLSIQLLFPEDFFPYTAGFQADSHQNAVHIQLSDRPAQQTFVCRVSGRSEAESGYSVALCVPNSLRTEICISNGFHKSLESVLHSAEE